MAERRIVNGWIYERDDKGVIRPVGPASPQSDPNYIPPLPMSPQQQRAESRQDAAEGRDETRTGIAVQSEARSEKKTAFDIARDLRQEYQSARPVKEYEIVARQFSNALTAGKNPAGDQKLINAYAQMLNPGSTVQIGEYAATEEIEAAKTRITNQLKREFGWDGVGRISEEARKWLVSEMYGIVANSNQSYRQARDYYRERAARNGFDADEVVGPHYGEPFLPHVREKLEGFGFKQRTEALAQDIAEPLKLAGGSDDRKSIPIPPQMQAEFQSFLTRWNGDPNEYAAYRVELDSKYGFPTTGGDKYREEAQKVHETLKAGGRVGSIPPVDAEMTGRDKLNASIFNNDFGAALMGAGSMGGAADEVFGTLKGLATGTDISTNIAQMDAMRQASANARPGMTIAGNLLGSIATGYGAGAAIPSLARTMATLPRAIGTGAGYGAASGALENNADRLGGAAMGAPLGAGGAVAGRYGGQLAGRLMETAPGRAVSNTVRSGINRFTPLRVNPTSNAPEMTGADRTIGGMLPSNDEAIAAARARMREAANLQVPFSLADADPSLRALGGTTARRSVAARDLAERTFDPRARGQADRAVGAIDTHLAPVTDITARANQLYDAGNTAARPLYNIAGQRAAPVDPRVAAFLNTDVGRDGLRRAYRIAEMEGSNPLALGFDLDEQGQVILREAPSFETLDLVKKGVDARLAEARNPVTGELDLRGNPELKALETWRQNFVSTLDQINPDYRTARQTYQPFARRAQALEQGRALSSPSTLPRELNAAMPGLDDITLPEARTGYATGLADVVQSRRLAGDPWEAIYGAPAQQQKLATMFPEGAPTFGRIYDLERDMSKTHREILGGSPTAARQAADEQLGGDMVAEGLGFAAAGDMGLGSLARRGIQWAADARQGVTNAQRADEIAPILFNTNPAEITRYLDDLAERQAQLAARRAAFRSGGGLFGTLAATSLGQ